MAVSTRQSTAAAFALEIDGTFAGFPSSFDGGGAFADVVESPATSGPMDKHIGSVHYDDIVVTSPFPDGPLATWVMEFLEGQAPERNGAVILLDLSWKPLGRLEWQGGAIHSVAFPALDGSAGKQAGLLTIAIRPTTTRDVGGGGLVLTPSKQARAKAWNSSNFAMSIPGVDCTRVTRVEPMVVTQTYLAPGSGRGAPKPGPVAVSDLVVTVGQSGMSDFVRWIDDFVVAGNSSKVDEKDATIHYLAPNLRDEIGSLSVGSTGIFRMDHEPQVAGVARTIRMKFSLYAEKVRWAPAAEPAAPAAPAAAAPTAPTAEAGVDRDVRDVLGKRLAAGEVVRRLREEPGHEQRPEGVEGQRLLGREVGLAWAQRHATLTELSEVAAADDQDWSSLSLPEGHSLAETLAATIDIPLLYDRSLELPRGALAEGLVAGVVEVLAELNAHLSESVTDASPRATPDDAGRPGAAFRALPPEDQKAIARNT